MWHVEGQRNIPEPPKSPYYTEELFNLIQLAKSEKLPLLKMGSKEWYNFLMSKNIQEETFDNLGNTTMKLIPCRIKVTFPDNDWDKTWSFTRLKA